MKVRVSLALLCLSSGCLKTFELFPFGLTPEPDAGTGAIELAWLFFPSGAAISDDGRFLASLEMRFVPDAGVMTFSFDQFSVRDLTDRERPALSVQKVEPCSSGVLGDCFARMTFGTADTVLGLHSPLPVGLSYSPGFLIDLKTQTKRELESLIWYERIVHVSDDHSWGLVRRQRFAGALGHLAWLYPLTGSPRIIGSICGDTLGFDAVPEVLTATVSVAFSTCDVGSSPMLRVFSMPGGSLVDIAAVEGAEAAVVRLAGDKVLWSQRAIGGPLLTSLSFVASRRGGTSVVPLGEGLLAAVSPDAQYAVLVSAEGASVVRTDGSSTAALRGVSASARPVWAWLDASTLYFISGALYRWSPDAAQVTVLEGPFVELVPLRHGLVAREVPPQGSISLTYPGHYSLSKGVASGPLPSRAWVIGRSAAPVLLGEANYWVWGETRSLRGLFSADGVNNGFTTVSMP